MSDPTLATELIGGIEKREIKIVAYDADWPKNFDRHARIIAKALGGAALRINHIGSTSVPQLAAKAIIDILVVVANSADESGYLSQLEAAGYTLRVREPNWNEHRMFRTPENDVHVHIYSAGCPEIERILTFRDRLRNNADDRSRYENTKRELATKEWPDMNAYAGAKSAVIEGIIAAALAVGEVSRWESGTAMIADVLRSFEMVMHYGSRMLADVPEERMTGQSAGRMNHPAWIVGHLAHSFQAIGGELGIKPWLPNGWEKLFGSGSSLGYDRAHYPSKPELLNAMETGRKKLREALNATTEGALLQPLPDERYRHIFPTLGSAVLHILTVHTSVHLGQLSAWRRTEGLPPVPDPM